MQIVEFFRVYSLIYVVTFLAFTPLAFNQSSSFPYDMETPMAIFDLPKILTEISGLSIHSDEKYLAAIQDEEGDLFLINKTTGKLKLQIPFGKDGDYEGVEIVDKTVYVVKSSGTIFEISLDGNEMEQITKYNTFLDKDYNVEGLAYDSLENRLLLACKNKAGDGEAFKFTKAIYAFDLKTKQLAKQAVILIKIETIQDYLDTSPAIRKLEELIEFFQPNQSKFTFSPSGMAIHPQSNDIYVLSTSGRLLVVMTKGGEIKHIEKLRKKYFPQPEGICFDTDGTLYLSTEGDGGKGRIFRYKKVDH